MATTVESTVIKNVGTDETLILETSATKKITLIGLTVTNLTNFIVYVNILVENDSQEKSHFLKETILANGSSLRAVSNGEKLILDYSNKLYISSSLIDSLDIVASYVES